jgi:hypothetical protein
MERILQSYVSGTRVILVMTWSNWISKYLNSILINNLEDSDLLICQSEEH